MLPTQILLNNLLHNTGQLVIPTDRVDPEALARPAAWDMRFIRRFMAVFGPVSSAFDFLTFWIMLALLHAGHTEFRTGWFVESIATPPSAAYGFAHRRRLYSQLMGSQGGKIAWNCACGAADCWWRLWRCASESLLSPKSASPGR